MLEFSSIHWKEKHGTTDTVQCITDVTGARKQTIYHCFWQKKSGGIAEVEPLLISCHVYALAVHPTKRRKLYFARFLGRLIIVAENRDEVKK